MSDWKYDPKVKVIYDFILSGMQDDRDEALNDMRPETLDALCGAVSVSTSVEIMGAIRTVLEGFDAGIFVRSIGHDGQSDWAFKLLPYIRALATLSDYAAILPSERQEIPHV